MHPTSTPLSALRRPVLCCTLAVLGLLSACGAPGERTRLDMPVDLAAQTPERVNAAPADYRGNDCEMLARFLPAMQHGYRITAGFTHTVYGWHVSAIEQVQREKGCDDPRAVAAAAAAKSAASGQLGVQLEPVTPAVARTLGMDAPRGALVVAPAGPAGLRERDVIVEIAGQRVQTPTELKSIVGLMAPGYRAPLRVWREGSIVELTIEISAPAAAAAQPTTVATKR
ncbi:PDZ domain-containing protein [Variovorax sp. J22G21]|uniref:S1C family serine protease n=1 Tax=Variovorax fucosicus TaxID=3053517 RepID=UPI002577B00C|nr:MULTISPECIES: PDZ domain-containing protein [unclassified Variovorax]MDM0040653.1 PDZ domain-containing protein [Variovorax sp. J22R193]MDM0062026.1 PDZ domain-containing protein [Variovorax sp. J22G21]